MILIFFEVLCYSFICCTFFYEEVFCDKVVLSILFQPVILMINGFSSVCFFYVILNGINYRNFYPKGKVFIKIHCRVKHSNRS